MTFNSITQICITLRVSNSCLLFSYLDKVLRHLQLQVYEHFNCYNCYSIRMFNINFDLRGGIAMEDWIEQCIPPREMTLFSRLTAVQISAIVQFSSTDSGKPQRL